MEDCKNLSVFDPPSTNILSILPIRPNLSILDRRKLLERKEQRVISQSAVALRFEGNVKLPDQREARHRNAHPFALVKGYAQILLEMLDEKARIEISLHHFRCEVIEDPALRGTLADRAQHG